MKRNIFGSELRKIVSKRITSDEIFILYPIFIESGFSVRNFAIKHGFDLKQGTAKRFKRQIDSQVKKSKKIARFSLKRAKKESSYILVRQKKFQDHDGTCDGCGTNEGYIDCSHRLPRKDYFDLIDDADNLDLYCRERCHKLVESGYYDELKNSEEVKAYILSKDPVYFRSKYKVRDSN